MAIASKLLSSEAVEIQLQPPRQPFLSIRVSGTQRGVQSAWLDRVRAGGSRRVEPQSVPRSLPPALKRAAEDMEGYFEGTLKRFTAPLDWQMQGSPFDREVWATLLLIPFGEVWSYAEVARRVGRPGAARAVGGAVGRNPIPIWIPCHRVVGSAGRLTGFSAGIQWKTILLEAEGVRLSKAPRFEDWQVLS